MSVFCQIDDKYVPLYRIMWISALPHFCGASDCEREGQYEVQLEHGETLWASREERDDAVKTIEMWHTDDVDDLFEEDD